MRLPAGLIRTSSRPATGETTQSILPVSAEERANRYGHLPGVINLSGGDFEMAARKLERLLFNKGLSSVVLDPDSVDASALAAAVTSIVSSGLIVICYQLDQAPEGTDLYALTTQQVLAGEGLNSLFTRYSLDKPAS